MNQIPPDLEKKLRRFAEAGLTVITNPAELPAPKPKGEQEGDAAPEPYDPWEVLVPPAFPTDVLPGELRNLTLAASRNIGCDPSAMAMSGLAALAAAIDGRSRLKMKRHDSWQVPPALWVALVGASSTKKTPAIERTWRVLWSRQADRVKDYVAAKNFWEVQNKGRKEEERDEPPDPPAWIVTADATPEALQQILASQERGIAMHRDELAGFIGGMEKYSSGRGPAADRAFYIEAFNGGKFAVNRITRGSVSISNLLITICGGIQPERLRELGNLTSDGLWQRFLPVIVGPAVEDEDVSVSRAEEEYAELVDYLLEQPPIFPVLSQAAQEEAARVGKNLSKLQDDRLLGEAFCSFVGKLHGYWGRLVLVLHAATRPPEGGGVVSIETAQRATTLILKYILPSAARVYTALGGGAGDAEAVKDVAGFILAKRKNRIRAADLSMNVRRARGMGLAEIQRLVSPLEAGGWLEPELDARTNNAWIVNPRVHELFAERAAEERKRREAVRRLIRGGSEAET